MSLTCHPPHLKEALQRQRSRYRRDTSGIVCPLSIPPSPSPPRHIASALFACGVLPVWLAGADVSEGEEEPQDVCLFD